MIGSELDFCFMPFYCTIGSLSQMSGINKCEKIKTVWLEKAKRK